MSIIFGLLALILSIIVPILIEYITNFQVIHFSLFFIIPVGALAVGYLCSIGYYFGLKKSNIKITKSRKRVALLLAIICIVGIYYCSYAMAHVDETGNLVMAFEGDHVSNYAVDGYGRLTFGTYTKYIIESTPISFSYRRTSLGNVSNPIFCWIFAGIDVLGVIIGSFLAASYIKDNNPYCDNCNKYKKKKAIFKIPKQNGDEFFAELANYVADINSITTLKSIVDKYTDTELKEYYECELIHCSDCYETELKFSLYEIKKKRKAEKNDKYSYSVKVNHTLMRDYL